MFSCACWPFVYLLQRNNYSRPLPIFKLGCFLAFGELSIYSLNSPVFKGQIPNKAFRCFWERSAKQDNNSHNSSELRAVSLLSFICSSSSLLWPPLGSPHPKVLTTARISCIKTPCAKPLYTHPQVSSILFWGALQPPSGCLWGLPGCREKISMGCGSLSLAPTPTKAALL